MLPIVSILIVFSLALATGCSPNHYRRSADREAAKVIADKTPLVPNMDPRFTIATVTNIALENFPAVTQTNDYFGADAALDLGSKVITLENALDLAVKHSRIHQNRKEQLFLQALDLTLARHRYTPIFSAGAGTTYQTSGADVEREIERITGGQVVRENQVVVEQQHSLSGRGGVGLNWFLTTGGRLAADFTTDFVRFMTGDPRWVAQSKLGATLTQPLLRGAGYKIALENLTQSERNLLYALREFTRFRKEFSVQVAASYYQVLQARDEVRNAWIGLQNFRQSVAREREFVQQNRSTQTSLGRLAQAELNTEGQWVDAQRNYRERLDLFKIQLGLPTDARVVLDDRELSRLKIEHPNIAVADAVKIALETRLDLYNQRDQFQDAARKIDVAANGLKPDLDLILRGDIDSKPGLRPTALDLEHARWSAGVDLDLPLDRKAERNAYRASLIAFERARRDLELAVDQIKLDVNEGWRALDQARRSFEIAEFGVTLSERRVEEVELRRRLGVGGGTAQDLVDARRDLISAQNQRTAALVRHTIARLQFWRDLGILYIQENGQWKEVQQAAN